MDSCLIRRCSGAGVYSQSCRPPLCRRGGSAAEVSFRGLALTAAAVASQPLHYKSKVVHAASVKYPASGRG